MKWLDASSKSFAERLVAFVCVEGILFSGSFCAIYWLKNRGLMPGLGLSNQFISRDEGLHQQFGTLMYRRLVGRLAPSTVETIVREAVDNEKAFIIEAIPCGLIGMNSALMSQYIEFVADRLLTELGYAKMYGAQNPFPWMQLISLSAKDNFFERFASEYQRAGVMASAEDQVFGLASDF
jgi:ribonucleotide reductase beta subunit family protein with ferritin-like domain